MTKPPMRQPTYLGTPATTFKMMETAISCPASMASVPNQRRVATTARTEGPSPSSHGGPDPQLEKTPALSQIVARRFLPDPGPTPEGEQQRADAGRAHPPP